MRVCLVDRVYVCVCVKKRAKESKKYVFGCYSSPLGGGIRTRLAARNEFTGPDLPETISLCGLHTFRVATRPPWASAHHTQLLEMANEIQNTFYRTHAFYLFSFIPCSLLPPHLSLSWCLSLILAVSFFILSCSPLITQSYKRWQMKKRSPFIGHILYFFFFCCFFSHCLSLSRSLSLFLSLWTGALTLFPEPRGLIGRREG